MNRLVLPFAFVGACLASLAIGVAAGPLLRSPAVLTGSPKALPATRMTGSMDEVPLRPPSPDESHIDLPPGAEPRTRAGAQALARKVFGDFSRHIQNFQKGDIGAPDLFFTPSHYRGWPGICQAEAVSVSDPPYGGLNTEKRYLVIGAFTSPPVVIDIRKPGYSEYQTWKRKAEANCGARDASTSWFTVHDAGAWTGARLFDSVIAAARAGYPDFPITCSPEHFVMDFPCGNPRGTLAGLAPADIDTIEGKMTIDRGIRRMDTTVSMHGDPYFVVVIRQEFGIAPGVRTPEVVKSVEVGRSMRPVTD